MAQVRDLLADVKKIDAIEASVTQLQTDVTNFDALPSQVNQTGKYLTTNGVDASWGTVTVPTAVSQLTNDSQYQTLSQVSAAVAGLVDSAPSTLDTLNELATALGNDPNFATTITNSIAGKANLSGGTFTGNVTVNGLFEVKDPGNYYNGHMRVGAVGQGYPYVNIGMDENDADNPGMVVGWYIKALGDIITNRIRLGGVYGQTGQIIAAPNTYEAQWTTIKTVNGTSILGAGDIIISAYADSKVQTYLTANNYVNTTALNTALSTKANQSTTYTKTETDTALALKANTSSLGSLATLSTINTGNITDGAVTGIKLSSALNQQLGTPFVKKQVVHRRPIYGVGTLSAVTGDVYRNDSTTLCTPYGPFAYGCPGVQPGAERRFRIYAVYSDGSQSQGEPQLFFRPNDSATNQVVFTLQSTWGGTGGSQRDWYSNEIVGTPWTDHANVRASGTGSVNYAMRFHYIEVQALDVFI